MFLRKRNPEVFLTLDVPILVGSFCTLYVYEIAVRLLLSAHIALLMSLCLHITCAWLLICLRILRFCHISHLVLSAHPSRFSFNYSHFWFQPSIADEID
jgi:hypothetical protein